MQIPVTLAALGILILALVLLRIFWHRLSFRAQTTLSRCAGVAIALVGFSFLTNWTLISHRLYALLLWGGVAGYGVLLVRFTFLTPRWLTSGVAVILFLPIFSSSIVLPLVNLFNRSLATTVPLADSLYSVRTIVDRSPIAPSAADLEVYYRPRWLPVFQRRRAGVRFFDTQCAAADSFAVLQPGHRSVLLQCPASPSDPPGTPAGGSIVPLR